MLDFLFITSPTNARNPHPPYYFLYLAAYLRDKGLKVDIIDSKGGDRPNDIQRHFKNIEDQLSKKKSKFVGLAAFHSDYNTIMLLGSIVKRKLPESTLLVGNAHSTINPEDFLFKNSPFDIAVLGEGEETCYELYLNSHKTINDEKIWVDTEIKGIAYYEEQECTSKLCGTTILSKVIKTKKRDFINLDSLSTPAYDLVDMDYYLRPQKLIIRRIYTSMVCIFAGRGCPYNCDFCAANVVWKANKGKAARLRPVQNVIIEIDYLKWNYDIDFFYLFDDMFGMSKKWMNEWFRQKYDHRKNIPYACQTRADITTEEMIRGLKETGCIQLDIGVETGTQPLLDRVNKKITLEQIRQVFEWCRKYKIRSFATMLLNLPCETTVDLKETYQFLHEIKPSAGVIFGITTPYPGTKIYEDYCDPKLEKPEYGLLINNRLNPNDERFRMAQHNLDLWKLLDKWNLHFKVHPFFERMWCLFPFQKLYWKAIFRSVRKRDYIKCWLKDIPKTFLLHLAHKLNIYLLLKKIQYGSKWK